MAPSLADLRQWFYSAGADGISYAQWEAFGGAQGDLSVSDAEYQFLTEASVGSFNAWSLMNMTVLKERFVTWGQSNLLFPAIGRNIADLSAEILDSSLANLAIPAFGWTQLAPEIPTRLLPAINPNNHNRLLLLGGTTDIANGISGADTFNLLLDVRTAWLAEIAAVGTTTDIVACTISDAAVFDTAPKQAEQAAYNALVMGSVLFDEVVDLHTAPFDDHTDTAFFSDGLHFTDAAVAEALVRISSW